MKAFDTIVATIIVVLVFFALLAAAYMHQVSVDPARCKGLIARLVECQTRAGAHVNLD